MLFSILAAALTAPLVPYPTVIRVADTAPTYDCGKVSGFEVTGAGAGSAQLTFTLDYRATYVVAGDTMPQAFAAMATVVMTAETAAKPIGVAFDTATAGYRVVHFLDYPPLYGEHRCPRTTPVDPSHHRRAGQ